MQQGHNFTFRKIYIYADFTYIKYFRKHIFINHIIKLKVHECFYQ